MRILITLLLVTFNSFGQTKELDELKKIWVDDMLDFGEIVLKEVNFNETFVPYKTNSRDYATNWENNVIQILNKVGIQTGTYYSKRTAKDGNNREMTLSSNRIARGRYWIDFSNYEQYTIKDSNRDFLIVGTINLNKSKTKDNFFKEYDKYFKKNKLDKRRKKQALQIVLEDLLKRCKINDIMWRCPLNQSDLLN